MSVLDDPRVTRIAEEEFVVDMPEGRWRVLWQASGALWKAWPPAGSGRQEYGLSNVATVIGYIFTRPEGPR